MKVLVTGGCGFLGSHVCELFRDRGWKVDAYDNMSKLELLRTGYNVDGTRNYNRRLLEGLGVQVQKADVRDYDTLLECAEGCDYIVHTAAQPAMTIALEDPRFDADNNVIGTLNVLEVGRQLDIPVAICSTIHVYGNRGRGFRRGPKAFHEGQKVLSGLLTPLHVSKYADELYARAYTQSYQTKVFVARLTGIYGPRQLGGEDHGWVANFAIRTVLGLPIKVYGTDKQYRDILYVKDAARAFLDWFETGCVSGVYNIGGGVECITTIKECLAILAKLTGKAQDITLEPARTGDLWYFCCNTSKARRTFGWGPKVLPRYGIEELVRWIKDNEGLFKSPRL